MERGERYTEEQAEQRSPSAETPRISKCFILFIMINFNLANSESLDRKLMTIPNTQPAGCLEDEPHP